MIRFIYKFLIVLLVSVVGIIEIYAQADSDRKFTVVIDAGHGGTDIGATDNGVKEKDINLSVAKQLQALIKKKMKNTNVVMTRDNDTFLSLQERADKANNSHGDIFVSIHTNSVDKRNKNRRNIAGASVYTLGLHKDENNLEVAMRENSVIELEQNYEQKYSGFDPMKDESYIIFEMAQKKNLSQSIHLADQIEKELVKSGRQERGVHQAGFWVLWATSMPSVLVELDFICNPQSAKYLSSEKGAKELAEAIFKAIQKYEDSWRKILKGNLSSDIKDAYVSNSQSQLADSYVSDSESLLENSFSITEGTQVAKARTRTHKSESKPIKNTGYARLNGERRRRSMASKEASMKTSYEKDNISFENLSSKRAVEAQGELFADLMANESSKLVQEKVSKKDKKKAEKKKKEDEKAKKAEEKKKKRKDDSYNAKVNKLVTVYKIQILASADLLSQSNPRFCGLSPISAFKENNLYKYYYGESTDKAEIEAKLPEVRKKIPDAFIVTSKKSVQTNN